MFTNKLSTTALTPQRSLRVDEKRVLTSGQAGKIIPIAYVPLLREDAVRRGVMRVNIDMMETAEMLMNGINVQVNAHLVPHLAMRGFTGMDELNRAYSGEDEDAPDFYPYSGPGRTDELYQTMGIHIQPESALPSYNGIVHQAYNELVNFRRLQRSQSLPVRSIHDKSLAEAFWQHTSMKHIVPSFDQALIDGEVALNVVDGQMPIRGLGVNVNANGMPADQYYESDGNLAAYLSNLDLNASGGDVHMRIAQDAGPNADRFRSDVWAEMQSEGITVSLANIEMAKKTAAMARLRTQYGSIDEDYIVDLLMDGIRVPEQDLKQPMLLAQKNTLIGYNRRFASDGASLEQSVTTGETFVDLSFRTPAINTGGIILITVEITPEQMFERTRDHFIHTPDPALLPQYTRDYLDPEKVSVVPNSHVDVSHSDPDSIFGYAPLNHEWMRNAPNIGGKYFRPEVDEEFDEDRQRIWTVETEDPELTADFYLCTDMHQKVFRDTEADPFEITARGRIEISGNTVFGAALNEATDDYARVAEKAPDQNEQIGETDLGSGPPAP